jgi:hypothetical protein
MRLSKFVKIQNKTSILKLTSRLDGTIFFMKILAWTTEITIFKTLCQKFLLCQKNSVKKFIHPYLCIPKKSK